MKNPTTPEWLAMTVITICVGLGVLALALASRSEPDLRKCPLCERSLP